jgi:hypothetical protein
MYRLPSLFPVDTFHHFGPRILNLGWKIAILTIFADENEQIRSKR